MPGARVAVPPVVPFAFGLAGVGLIIAAFRNVSPLQKVRAILSGTGTAATIDTGAGVTDAATPPDRTDVTPANSYDIVSIGQGGHKLRKDAAQWFAAWEKQFGAQIVLTDSTRTYAQQAAGYAKDPKRFGSPDRSEHVKGTAVDVNLGAIGATPPNATWQKLYATATALGWKNPRGPYSGDRKEPWHFSRNGG